MRYDGNVGNGYVVNTTGFIHAYWLLLVFLIDAYDLVIKKESKDC